MGFNSAFKGLKLNAVPSWLYLQDWYNQAVIQSLATNLAAARGILVKNHSFVGCVKWAETANDMDMSLAVSATTASDMDMLPPCCGSNFSDIFVVRVVET